MESFVGFCDDAGHVALDDRDGFLTHVRKEFTGQEFVVTVRSRSALRSIKANNYYWSVVVDAAVKETGQDDQTIHAFWCDKFLPDEKKRTQFYSHLTGETLEVEVDTRRTSKLTGTPFYDYVENCRLWLQEFLGVTTPDPDPEYWRKRKAREEVTT